MGKSLLLLQFLLLLKSSAAFQRNNVVRHRPLLPHSHGANSRAFQTDETQVLWRASLPSHSYRSSLQKNAGRKWQVRSVGDNDMEPEEEESQAPGTDSKDDTTTASSGNEEKEEEKETATDIQSTPSLREDSVPDVTSQDLKDQENAADPEEEGEEPSSSKLEVLSVSLLPDPTEEVTVVPESVMEEEEASFEALEDEENTDAIPENSETVSTAALADNDSSQSAFEEEKSESKIPVASSSSSSSTRSTESDLVSSIVEKLKDAGIREKLEQVVQKAAALVEQTGLDVNEWHFSPQVEVNYTTCASVGASTALFSVLWSLLSGSDSILEKAAVTGSAASYLSVTDNPIGEALRTFGATTYQSYRNVSEELKEKEVTEILSSLLSSLQNNDGSEKLIMSSAVTTALVLSILGASPKAAIFIGLLSGYSAGIDGQVGQVSRKIGSTGMTVFGFGQELLKQNGALPGGTLARTSRRLLLIVQRRIRQSKRANDSSRKESVVEEEEPIFFFANEDKSVPRKSEEVDKGEAMNQALDDLAVALAGPNDGEDETEAIQKALDIINQAMSEETETTELETTDEASEEQLDFINQAVSEETETEELETADKTSEEQLDIINQAVSEETETTESETPNETSVEQLSIATQSSEEDSSYRPENSKTWYYEASEARNRLLSKLVVSEDGGGSGGIDADVSRVGQSTLVKFESSDARVRLHGRITPIAEDDNMPLLASSGGGRSDLVKFEWSEAQARLNSRSDETLTDLSTSTATSDRIPTTVVDTSESSKNRLVKFELAEAQVRSQGRNQGPKTISATQNLLKFDLAEAKSRMHGSEYGDSNVKKSFRSNTALKDISDAQAMLQSRVASGVRDQSAREGTVASAFLKASNVVKFEMSTAKVGQDTKASSAQKRAAVRSFARRERQEIVPKTAKFELSTAKVGQYTKAIADEKQVKDQVENAEIDFSGIARLQSRLQLLALEIELMNESESTAIADSEATMDPRKRLLLRLSKINDEARIAPMLERIESYRSKAEELRDGSVVEFYNRRNMDWAKTTSAESKEDKPESVSTTTAATTSKAAFADPLAALARIRGFKKRKEALGRRSSVIAQTDDQTNDIFTSLVAEEFTGDANKLEDSELNSREQTDTQASFEKSSAAPELEESVEPLLSGELMGGGPGMSSYNQMKSKIDQISTDIEKMEEDQAEAPTKLMLDNPRSRLRARLSLLDEQAFDAASLERIQKYGEDIAVFRSESASEYYANRDLEGGGGRPTSLSLTKEVDKQAQQNIVHYNPLPALERIKNYQAALQDMRQSSPLQSEQTATEDNYKGRKRKSKLVNIARELMELQTTGEAVDSTSGAAAFGEKAGNVKPQSGRKGPKGFARVKTDLSPKQRKASSSASPDNSARQTSESKGSADSKAVVSKTSKKDTATASALLEQKKQMAASAFQRPSVSTADASTSADGTLGSTAQPLVFVSKTSKEATSTASALLEQKDFRSPSVSTADGHLGSTAQPPVFISKTSRETTSTARALLEQKKQMAAGSPQRLNEDSGTFSAGNRVETPQNVSTNWNEEGVKAESLDSLEGQSTSISRSPVFANMAESFEEEETVRLIVGNLWRTTRVQSIRTLFETCGPVKSCIMPRGRGRGYCYVDMPASAANLAIRRLNGYELEGWLLTVEKAKPFETQPMQLNM